jgi:hypothetical protein
MADQNANEEDQRDISKSGLAGEGKGYPMPTFYTNHGIKSSPENGRYLSQLLALDRLTVHRQVVQQMENSFSGFFSASQLSEFASIPKQSVWNKVFGAKNSKKNVKMKGIHVVSCKCHLLKGII